MAETEADVEHYLCTQVADVLGGRAYKFSSPARRSVPDRICLWADANILFVECKAPDADMNTPHVRAQLREHERLRRKGFRVEIVASKSDIDRLVREVVCT